MKRPPSCGQHLRIGKLIEIEVLAEDDFLAGGILGLHGFGKRAGEGAKLRQHLELVKKTFGGFHVHQPCDALGDFVEVIDAEGHGHAPLAAELVDQDFVAGKAFDIFKQQSRTAGCVIRLGGGVFAGCADFADAVGDLGDFEVGRDLFADPLELAVFVEMSDPVAQIVVGQGFLRFTASHPY